MPLCPYIAADWGALVAQAQTLSLISRAFSNYVLGKHQEYIVRQLANCRRGPWAYLHGSKVGRRRRWQFCSSDLCCE